MLALIICLFAFLLLLCLLAEIRNNWVCNKSIELIYSDYDTFKRLPSYDAMLFRYFYIWDIKKMPLKD